MSTKQFIECDVCHKEMHRNAQAEPLKLYVDGIPKIIGSNRDRDIKVTTEWQSHSYDVCSKACVAKALVASVDQLFKDHQLGDTSP